MAEDLMNFEIPQEETSIIKVIGVGGGGSNAVNYMFEQGIKDVSFVVCNTDAQALKKSPVTMRIQLGASLTEGRGAGNKPEQGRQAAIENLDDINEVLSKNTKMVFITAGMGGGTGTGAAPIIAKAAKELDILTVAIVTIPFKFEGQLRINQAIDGIAELKEHVDSLLVINNEKLREMYGDLKLSDAFSKADNVLTIAAKGIAEIITLDGYINVDFADVQTVMSNSGVAIMGAGSAEGENRAIKAIQDALNSPLLNNNDVKGAKNILLNITSGSNEISMDEVGQVTDYIQDSVENDSNIIWGTGHDETLDDIVNVTIIATGFGTSSIPELYTREKPAKVVNVLDDIQEDEICEEPVQENFDDNVISDEGDEEMSTSQKTIDFKNDLVDKIEKENLYNELYGNEKQNETSDLNEKAKKAQERLTNLRMKFDKLKEMSHIRGEDDINELENEPAYKRKKINLESNTPSKAESDISKYTLSDDDDDKTKLRENNSFLHDNVD